MIQVKANLRGDNSAKYNFAMLPFHFGSEKTILVASKHWQVFENRVRNLKTVNERAKLLKCQKHINHR